MFCPLVIHMHFWLFTVMLIIADTAPLNFSCNNIDENLYWQRDFVGVKLVNYQFCSSVMYRKRDRLGSSSLPVKTLETNLRVRLFHADESYEEGRNSWPNCGYVDDTCIPNWVIYPL